MAVVVLAMLAPTMAQTQFASASITPSTSGQGAPTGMRLQPGGGFSATNVTLKQLIEFAYARHPFDRREIVGGPAWVDSDRFDVTAKAASEHVVEADGATRQTWAMLASLLAERFKLTVREEPRERQVYGLLLGSPDGGLGPKLKRSDVDCGAVMRGEAKVPAGQGPPCGLKTPPGRLFANTFTLPAIASFLSRFLDRPVIDRTGLTGRFDVEIEAAEIKAPPDYKPGPSDIGLPPAPGTPLSTALREQLGLKLERQTGYIPVLVIEEAHRPTR